MKVAKLSVSQRSSHHFMVTRSPNHWWLTSWAMTSATCFLIRMLLSLSTRSTISLNVMALQFSIAPAANSGGLWRLESLLWPLHRHRHGRQVGNYGGVAVCSDCKLEVSLVEGMIHAWQETRGRDGLELCRGHVAAVIRCLVQTYELVRDRASVFDAEFSRELPGPNREVFSF